MSMGTNISEKVMSHCFLDRADNAALIYGIAFSSNENAYLPLRP